MDCLFASGLPQGLVFSCCLWYGVSGCTQDADCCDLGPVFLGSEDIYVPTTCDSGVCCAPAGGICDHQSGAGGCCGSLQCGEFPPYDTSGRQLYHGVISPPGGEVNLGSPHHLVARFLLYTTFTPWFSDMCQPLVFWGVRKRSIPNS